MKTFNHLFLLLLVISLSACDWFNDPQDNSNNSSSNNTTAIADIIGTVVDDKSLEPIAGAKVTVNPGNLIAYSNDEGDYEFLDLEVGKYTVSASADYYSNLEGSIDLPKEGLDLTIYMERSVVEDYSSAIVQSCDNNLKADIVSCRRSGNKVVFQFMLTNTGLGDINDFRIEGNSGSTTIIFDDLGNSYIHQQITLGSQTSYSGYTLVSSPLLEYVPCKGSVVVTNVPNQAEMLTVKLQVYAYNASVLQQRDYITFKNIPIY